VGDVDELPLQDAAFAAPPMRVASDAHASVGEWGVTGHSSGLTRHE